MTRNQILLPSATGKTQQPVDRPAPTPVTVALLKFSNGAPIVRWGVLDWGPAMRLSAGLMNQHYLLSYREASEILGAIWTPLSSLPPASDFTDADAIHFFRVPVQSECSIHGRWIESVSELFRVRLELKEIKSGQPFSICSFYGAS